jgi:hypothetical protein
VSTPQTPVGGNITADAPIAPLIPLAREHGLSGAVRRRRRRRSSASCEMSTSTVTPGRDGSSTPTRALVARSPSSGRVPTLRFPIQGWCLRSRAATGTSTWSSADGLAGSARRRHPAGDGGRGAAAICQEVLQEFCKSSAAACLRERLARCHHRQVAAQRPPECISQRLGART